MAEPIAHEGEEQREIALIDVDCFHYQVMSKDRPDLKEKPVIVTNRSKKVIAVSYAARKFGIERSTGIMAARSKCPELIVLEIPDRWLKPDQQTPRLESNKIYDSIAKFFLDEDIKLERSSKDELYIDLTNVVSKRIANAETLKPGDFFPKTLFEGAQKISRDDLNGSSLEISNLFPGELRLLHAAVICGKLLQTLKAETGYEASAGVANSKLYAKLACGHHKPHAVTLFMKDGLLRLAKEIKHSSIPGLGNKRGRQILAEFSNSEEKRGPTMFDVSQIPREWLVEKFGEKIGINISELAKGVDTSLVKNKSTTGGITCGRSMIPRLRTVHDLEQNIQNFSEELMERNEEEIARERRRILQVKVEVKRPPPPEGIPRKAESGTFKVPRKADYAWVFKESMNVLRSNWESHGKNPLNEITSMALVVKRFAKLGEDLE